MSRHDDDQGVSPLDDRAADRLLSGRPVEDEPGLTAFVQQLQAFTPSAAPAPSAELAELLAGGFPVVPTAPAAPPRRGWFGTAWTRLGVAGASFAAVLLGAGAANALPASAQDVLADVVGFVTPFELPRPADDPDPDPDHDPAPVPSPSATTRPTTTPAPQVVPPRPTPRPAVSEDPDDEPSSGSSQGPSDDDEPGDDDRSPTPRPSEDDEPEEEQSEEPSEDSSSSSGSGSGSSDADSLDELTTSEVDD